MRHSVRRGVVVARPGLRAVAGVVAAWATLIGGLPTSADAQLRRRRGEEPFVRRLEFTENAALEDSELDEQVLTEASGCRSLFAAPVCLVYKGDAVYARRRLDRAELERDALRLKVHYWRRGWRAARVVPQVLPVDSATVDVRFVVTEGPPTLVGALDLGPADTLLSRRAKRQALDGLETGQPLDLVRLDSVGARVTRALDARGYGDAQVIPSVVDDSTSPRKDVTLTTYRPYPTYVEGIRVEGTERYDPRLVANALVLRPGQRFSREATVESQRALYEVGYFRRAVVRSERGAADSLKVLVAQVEELPPKNFRLTGGVSTVDFLQVDARYVDANFRGAGARLTLQGTVGNLLADQLNNRFVFNNVLPPQLLPGDATFLKPTWQANAEVRRRWLSDWRNQTALGVFGYRRAAPGIFVDEGYGASATFTRDVRRRWPVSGTYRFEFTGVTAADTYFCVNFGVCDDESLRVLRRRQRLSPLALTTLVDRRDDPIGPTRGWFLRGELEYASRWTLSDLWYSRAEVEATRYYPLSSRWTLGLHARAGAVTGQANPRFGGAAIVHPRRRFYAGGAQSVRGFGENQLGPRVLVIPVERLRFPDVAFAGDSTATVGRQGCPGEVFKTNLFFCPVEPIRFAGDTTTFGNFRDGDFSPKPIGGTAMAEGTIELRWRAWGPVTLATFLDAGWVRSATARTLTRQRSVITPGVGVRFVTPVGPIRLDVGYNPLARELLPVVTDLVDRDLGSTLQPLGQLRSFNPATGTGLGGIFNRLTLHLSVGEAF